MMRSLGTTSEACTEQSDPKRIAASIAAMESIEEKNLIEVQKYFRFGPSTHL